MSNESMSMGIYLDDFFIQDLWSGSEHYQYLAQLKGDSNDQDQGAEEGGRAISVTYEYKTEYETCPYHIDASFERNLWIYLSLPLILELTRTMGHAFSGEEVDLKFYEKRAANSIRELRTLATGATGLNIEPYI